MQKKAQKKVGLIVLIAVIAALIYFGFYYGVTGTKTLKEHAEPVDISTEQEGQGMDMGFYKKVDGEWVKVDIPDWFKVVDTTGMVGAIVEHPPAPICTIRTDCPGAGTNPNIDCWQSKCVLTNIDGMDVVIKVANSASFDFNDVYISSANPVGLDNALLTGIANKKQLPAGSTVSWTSSIMDFDVLGWIGTTQIFSITVAGTNSYSGQQQSSSDSITLQFSADPTGTFSVVIEAGI